MKETNAMLMIRFNRTGRKNRPNYRVVVQEHTTAPGGRHIEVLGSYDPYSKKAVLEGGRARYWIGKGAQLSDTAYNLFVREGILAGKKRGVKMPKPVVKEAAAPVVSEKSPKDSGVVSVATPSEKQKEKTEPAKAE